MLTHRAALAILVTFRLPYLHVAPADDSNDALDFGDLIEYCWGDAATTTYGRRRAADGHPSVYNVTIFELGNEQYNPNFVEQVRNPLQNNTGVMRGPWVWPAQ